MSLVDKIKSDVKKSGTNKGKFLYFKEGEKRRIRFLQDMDDGMEVVFHDSYEKGINVPCQEIFGRNCPYCDDEDLRTRSLYAWSVWDYESKEVKVFMYAVNNCSPIPALMAMYETYGTLVDRDFVISVTGKQQNKTFSVVPMDKNKFRNDKAKPLSKKALLQAIDKAYSSDTTDNEDDEEESKSIKSKAKQKDDWEDDDEDEALPYEDMTAKELYGLCKERDIECVPKKPAKYYINLLEEYDSQQDDWGDEEENEDEDW